MKHRKEYRVNNTGNSIANYKEVWVDCDECHGTGQAHDDNDLAKQSVDCKECSGNGGYYVKR